MIIRYWERERSWSKKGTYLITILLAFLANETIHSFEILVSNLIWYIHSIAGWHQLNTVFKKSCFLPQGTKIMNCPVKIAKMNCPTTAQKMKFFIKDFFSKCDQICRNLRIRSHLLKKPLMENFIFCAAYMVQDTFRSRTNAQKNNYHHISHFFWFSSMSGMIYVL